MPDFKIKNLINEYTEVRIIPINTASTITNTHDQLSSLDDSGYEYGIVLAPGPAPIQCDGAIAHVSIINIGGEVMEGPNPFTLEVNDLPPVECADFNDLANALDDENFRVYVLEDWDPLFAPPV